MAAEEGMRTLKNPTTIAVIGTGDMGSAVGGALNRAGLRSVTALANRGVESRRLAELSGIENLGSLRAVAQNAELILSIVPPAAAVTFADNMAAAMVETGTRPVFVDCNAVSPATVRSIARVFESIDVPFVDAGIIGRGPRPDADPPTRIFVSGAQRRSLLDLKVPELRLIDMGHEIGTASAIKMAYAAERLGVRAELMKELELSQDEAVRRMRARVPYLAAVAERFAGEMAEIAATYEAAGVTPLFHRGAEWVFTELATTSLAGETRATLPAHRSLDVALAVFSAVLDRGQRS